MTRRVTIADIAAAAGVSKGAVSYALNGRPGVSEATRGKILAIAAEMGFVPNRAARSLSVSSAQAVGIALRRSARTLGIEPYFMELISGIEATLSAGSFGLTLQIVGTVEEELEVYRRWWAERRVDGVLLCDVGTSDRRLDFVADLGLPAVAVGGPIEGARLPAVWHDDAEPCRDILEYLYALGHRRVARVAGLPRLLHTSIRDTAYAETAAGLDLESMVTFHSDYTGEQGAQITRRLLSSARRPTAIIYDNDVMAVAGLGVAHELGLEIPEQLSVVAWDDSPLCRLTHPALTSLARDIPAYGSKSAEVLMSLISADGTEPPNAAVRTFSVQCRPAQLSPRGSTGPVPA
ncbi:LacI family transcriptional regulator [Glycomyces sp. TRM65418]|uniref:LacI family DNA-binding transcriptional regulator n=1 Tax=Glycomyces sp. TRM65418 TaxID=2867006 RepID=UPI001CE6D4C0|nr:LacI family DNA-binding transcriptional regulator [Glycomyces sp. TRM65418]MCC3764932.1 LacI family transcriptional regulator [Glycomyces sp. TRM65418]QZD54572.1 LacI family transcriptional regulator [Glycomyces sp. TRM65418]